MAKKGPRRTGTKWRNPIEDTMKKRGTGRSSKMDEIMGGLSSGRKKKAPKKKGR